MWITAGAGTGIHAGNDAQRDINPGEGTTIYAPTHQSAGGACIETVTIHENPNPGASVDAHGFWDWCRASPGWGVYEQMTSTWRSKYVRTEAGEERYYTVVLKDPASNCWNGSLWNYDIGFYEIKMTSCGTTKTGFGNTGWTMWESWFLSGCPAMSDVRASMLLTYSGNTQSGWEYLGPTNTSTLGPSAGSCFATGSYSWHLHSFNWEWEAHTP